MQIINLATGLDVTHEFESKKLNKMQAMLRLAKYRRLRPKKSKRKRKKR